MLRITPAQAVYYRTQAFIAEYNSLPPAVRELADLDNKDARWTDADRARRAELASIIQGGG